MEEQNEKEMTKKVEDFDKMLDEAIAEYEKDKGKYNEAGFAALDVNKDGQLVKQEVVDAFLWGAEKNGQLLDAFPTGPSILAKKQLDKAMAEMKALLEKLKKDQAALTGEGESTERPKPVSSLTTMDASTYWIMMLMNVKT